MPKKSIGGLFENVCGVGYLMKSMPNIDKTDYKEIELQPTSLDIWKTKYRLTSKDGTAIDSCIDDTYQRIARSLADVEKEDLREKSLL